MYHDRLQTMCHLAIAFGPFDEKETEGETRARGSFKLHHQSHLSSVKLTIYCDQVNNVHTCRCILNMRLTDII